MPSFQDSAVIFFIALLLFGPKKLPELARQLGKLMGEFRRASNEFRMQMEDELRIADQQEQQKKIVAMQAAAPVTPVLPEDPALTENAIAPPELATDSIATPADSDVTPERIAQLTRQLVEEHPHIPSAPLPIATSGELNLMPPSTGLPISNSALSPVLESIPQESIPQHSTIAEPDPIASGEASEAAHHG